MIAPVCLGKLDCKWNVVRFTVPYATSAPPRLSEHRQRRQSNCGRKTWISTRIKKTQVKWLVTPYNDNVSTILFVKAIKQLLLCNLLSNINYMILICSILKCHSYKFRGLAITNYVGLLTQWPKCVLADIERCHHSVSRATFCQALTTITQRILAISV